MSQKVLIKKRKGLEHVGIDQLLIICQRHGAVDCVQLDGETIRARMSSDSVARCKQFAEIEIIG